MVGSVMPLQLDDLGLRKKDITIQAILDAAGLLLIEKMGSAPHAREIAAKSGYSVGTIYNYFSSVGDVVSHLVLKRQTETMKKIEAIIAQHDATQPVDVLCTQIVETIFSSYSSIKPVVLRFAYNMAVSQSAKPENHDRVVDRLVQPIHEVAKRDKTGTFRVFDDQELTLYLRGMVYLCRYPLLDGSELYGTPEHQRIVLGFMIRTMTQTAVSEIGRPTEPPAPVKAVA